MISSFLRSQGVLLALLAVLAFQWVQVRDQRRDIAELRRDLANALVDRKLLERVIAERPTPQQPLIVTTGPTGVQPVPVTVYVQPPGPVRPGEPPPAPRLVAESPSVYCKTKQECDRLYERAPQSLDVEAQIRVGTIATVCLRPFDAGACPEGQRANLPLVEPLKFNARFVLADRGIFQGLVVSGSPVEITRVRTETRIETGPLAPPRLPYHLGLEAGFLGSQPFVGAVYVNRAWGGFYRVAVGAGPGFTAGVFFTIPIR